MSRDKRYNDILMMCHIYAYHQAYEIATKIADCPKDLKDILLILKERRELNLKPIFEQPKLRQRFLVQYQDTLALNPLEEEQLANYIFDLQAKSKNEQAIDFMRAMSPAIYQIFKRLIKKEIPQIEDYIKRSEEGHYDRWEKAKLKTASIPALQTFYKQHGKTISAVTSDSFEKLIEGLDLAKDVKKTVVILRDIEKEIRNPLAHRIKAFDEKKLRRRTQFSSQMVVKMLIKLVQKIGILYNEQTFYFDQVNRAIIQKIIETA